MLRNEWHIALILVVAVLALVLVLEPLPPSVIRMAKGQPNSGLEVMARKYAAYLADHGVRVEFIDTDGAPDSLKKIAEGAADVGLSQSGLPAPANVHYLGSVALQPFWLIYKGQPAVEREVVPFLAGKRVSIGVEGSGSHAISTLFLSDVPQNIRQRIETVTWNNAKTVSALKHAELDAAFLLASFESGNTQSLLKDPDLHLFNFVHARGFANLHSFLQPVTLPSGSLRHFPPSPPQDITMFAASMTLVVRSDLHPATQKLLLSASRSITQQGGDIISRQRKFPAFIDQAIARSPIAERYYLEGEPFLMHRLPYWLASLIDTFWVGMLAVMALAFPLSKAIAGHRRLAFTAMSSRRYSTLRKLDERFNAAQTRAEQLECLQELDQLLLSVRGMWVPNGSSSDHGLLLATALQLEQKFRQVMNEENSGSFPPAEQAQGLAGTPKLPTDAQAPAAS